MRLWTIQPPCVIDIINETGQFTCPTDLSINYADFHNAYRWLITEMDKRNIPHPENLTLPLWAWHTFHGKQKKPDFRRIGLGCTGEKCVCIEFEIPDNHVLLSDFDAWHYVLNNTWYDNSTNETEFDEMHDWFDTLPQEKQQELKVNSWQKIFDTTYRESDWQSNGKYVQATFWTLTKSMIRNVKYFIAR